MTDLVRACARAFVPFAYHHSSYKNHGKIFLSPAPHKSLPLVGGDTYSVKREHAFFHLHCVHHISRFSIPYTLRHFLTSLRDFLCIGDDFGEDDASPLEREPLPLLPKRIEGDIWKEQEYLSVEAPGVTHGTRMRVSVP